MTIGLDGWEPFNSEFVISSRGVNGQDVFLTIEGLEVGSPTSLLVESVFRTETVGGSRRPPHQRCRGCRTGWTGSTHSS